METKATLVALDYLEEQKEERGVLRVVKFSVRLSHTSVTKTWVKQLIYKQ
jgi:hypothetical protein